MTHHPLVQAPDWFSYLDEAEWGYLIEIISIAAYPWSWFWCLLFVRDFTFDECTANFGAIFLHAFGYIERDVVDDAVYRQGVRDMKSAFNYTPDWKSYDGTDTTTITVQTYWENPGLGGGSLLEDLQTPTDPAIKTPLLDLMESDEARSYGFWGVESIQYTRNSPYYFVDVLILASEEQNVEALGILKTASAYHKCCWHDEQHWALHMTGFARIYYYKMDDRVLNKDYLYALYEGQVKDGEPYGFGRYIHGLQNKSFIGYFKDKTTTDVGLGLLFEDRAPLFSGPYMADTNFMTGQPLIKLVFNKFDNDAMCGAYQVHMEQLNLCHNCPDWNFPDKDGKTCNPVECRSDHYFINPIGECKECEDDHSFPDTNGWSCNQVDCAEDELLTLQGTCADACGEFEYTNTEKKKCETDTYAMEEALATQPSWTRYNGTHERTQDVARYWFDKSFGGGPLTGDLATNRISKIRTPLLELMNEETTYGLYQINRVIVISGESYYRDILLLSTKKADTPQLAEYANATRAQCCYTMEGANGIEQYLTGFARIEVYMDTELNGLRPQFLEIIYEGQILEGVPHGFGRKVDGRASQSFIGYFKDWYNVVDENSLGLYFEYFELQYQGLYQGGPFYMSQGSSSSKNFRDFDYSVLRATQWTQEMGYCTKAAGNDLTTFGTIIPKPADEDACKETCIYDPECSAYEWHPQNVQCRHFYGPVEGDGADGITTVCNQKPKDALGVNPWDT